MRPCAELLRAGAGLADTRSLPHAQAMFAITEAEAAAIRAAFEQRGELSAAIELRRLFPGVTDTAQARACAMTIAGWKRLPVPLRSMPRGRLPGRLPGSGAAGDRLYAGQSSRVRPINGSCRLRTARAR